MHQIICSTGALFGIPNGRNYRLLADCVDKLRCDGYEFMFYSTWYDQIDQVASFLSGLGIPIPLWHCEKHIGEKLSLRGEGDWDEAFRQFEEDCQLAVYLGARRMVIHLWDGLTSDQHFQNNLDAYPLLLARAQRHGMELMVENVVCNHGDPMTHWQQLHALDADVRFTLDTKMAAFHRQMDLLYEKEYAWLWQGPIRHLHVNDYHGGYLDWPSLHTLHIGQGDVDFEKFFAFLPTVHYQGDYTVEATSFLPDGVIHCDDLNRTFDFIRSHI